MTDYNSKGRPTISRLLNDIKQDIENLQVTDPRLEFLRERLYDLSVKVDELQERVRQLERHEQFGLQLARAVAIAAFVVLVVLVSRFI